MIAVPGGNTDNYNSGAAWVFTRSANNWTQQGEKLVGTGAIGDYVYQGNSVSISADGNTAIVGGPGDSIPGGSVWVYNRSGGVWAQQGQKLTGTGAIGYASIGVSVSLSADGGTVLAGGEGDNAGHGAAWIFGTDKSAAGIAELSVTQSHILLYPVPNMGSFTMQTSNSIGSSFYITDMLGHIITERTIDANNQPVNLLELNDGIYVLVVKGLGVARFKVEK